MNILTVTTTAGLPVEILSDSILSVEALPTSRRLIYFSPVKIPVTIYVTDSISTLYNNSGCLFEYTTDKYLCVDHVDYLAELALGICRIGYNQGYLDSTESLATIMYRINSAPVNLTSQKQNIVFVSDPGQFPLAVAGVRTLEDNTTYFINGTVDLLGDRLVAGQNTALLGGSSENSRIKSTGLVGTALVTSEWSLPMRGLTIEADVALDLDATANANQALDWFGVNFTDCPTIGTIKSYNNFIATDCGVLNSANWTFDGTIGTVGFGTCIFDGRSGQTTLIFPSTLTITRRIRFNSSPFVVLPGETGINLSTSAVVPVESYRCHFGDFSGGGTYLAGVLSTDNKALFTETKGVPNSASIANYYMFNNATLTDIVTQGVAVKIAGTTTQGTVSQKFTYANNRATYVGAIQRDFKVTYVATIIGDASNKQIGLYVSKSNSLVAESEQYVTTNAASRAEAVTIQAVVSLNTNEYIEAWVENDTDATDVTVSYLNVIIEALN